MKSLFRPCFKTCRADSYPTFFLLYNRNIQRFKLRSRSQRITWDEKLRIFISLRCLEHWSASLGFPEL